MKQIVKPFFIFIMTMIVISCNDTSEMKKTFYVTGELKEEIEQLTEECLMIKSYSKNGDTLSIGKVCNGNKEGDWTELHLNGKIKWKGQYLNNYRIYNELDTSNLSCNLYIDSNDDTLVVNKEYFLNVSVDFIHPEDVYIGVSNAITSVNENSINGLGNFKVVPNGNGNIKLYTFININGKRFLACKDYLIVESR